MLNCPILPPSIFVAIVAFVFCESASIQQQSQKSNGKVVMLDDQKFGPEMRKYPVALTAFTVPWCGYCQRLYPKLDEAAAKTKDTDLFVVRLNCDDPDYTAKCKEYEIGSYPTLYMFVNGVITEQYNGNHDAETLVNKMAEVGWSIGADIGALSFDNPTSYYDDETVAEVENNNNGQEAVPCTVVEITPENYDYYIVDSCVNVLVSFYKPDCMECSDHLTKLDSLVEKVAENNVLVAKMDVSSVDVPALFRDQVKSYPAMFWMASDCKEPIKFGKEPSVDDYVNFVGNQKANLE